MLTNVKTAEAACGTNAAGSSLFGNATVVRLVNTTSTARVVTVATAVGGSTVGTFTLLGNTVEFVEKKTTEAIFAAHASVLGTSVGYAN